LGKRINLIGLFVSDIAQMVAFYRDVLGFEIDWNGQGPFAEFKNENIRFAMYERKQLPALLGQAPGYPNGINGTFELAIDCPVYGDVDKEFDKVVAAGATAIYAPRIEPWGMRSSMIADPEGNLIEIFSIK
jgi:lactoylglutathione lyase